MKCRFVLAAATMLLQVQGIWKAQEFAPGRALTGHRDNVYSLAVSPDGRWVVSASEDMTACVWDWQSGKRIARLEHAGPVYEALFSPDGRWLATADGDAKVHLYTTEGFRVARVLAGHSGPVYALAFSPEGKWLATGGGEKDHTCRIWEVGTGQLVKTLHGHTDAIYGVAFAADGTLATASGDKTLRLWNWQRGKGPQNGECASVMGRELRGHNSYVYRCRFSLDGKYLASASHDRTVRIWEKESGQLVQTLQLSKQPIYALAFSPDGQLLACVGEEHAVRLVNWRSGQIVGTLTGAKDALYAVHWFSAGGKTWLIYGGGESQIVLQPMN